MKRTACGAIVLLFLCTSVRAQQRKMDLGMGSTPRQAPVLADASRLQWFMLTGAIPASTSGVNSGGGANAASAPPGSTVSISTLQVPEAAMKEMLEFQKKFNAGKLEDSAKHLEKAIRIYPQWAAAHYNLGQCFVRMHEYDRAIPEFQSAAALDTRTAQPWVSLAGVHLLQKEYAEGETAARRALEIDPVNGGARYFLGRILALEEHDTPEVVEMLEKSRDDYPAAYLILANEYLKRSQTGEAVSELRSYLAQPNAPQKEKVECMVQYLTQPSGTVTCAIQ